MKRARLLPLITLTLLLAGAGAAAAQDEADKFILEQMKQQNIPGMSVAVVRNGEIVKARGYGIADRTSVTPATPETVYKIASVSKQFIAAGVMLLVHPRDSSNSEKLSGKRSTSGSV